MHCLHFLLCRQALRSFAQNMSSGLALPLVAQNKSASITDGLHKHCQFTMDLSVEANPAGGNREGQQRNLVPPAASNGSAEGSAEGSAGGLPGGASRQLRQVSASTLVAHEGFQVWDCKHQGVELLTSCWACHRAVIRVRLADLAPDQYTSPCRLSPQLSCTWQALALQTLS